MPNQLGPGKAGPGRPKGSRNKITLEIKALAQKHGETAMNELVRLACAAESEAARVAAIKEILDRGYGKAVQAHDGDGEGGPINHKVVVEFIKANQAIEHRDEI